MTIPFISKNGLFLGDYNTKLSACDVRTFVANHQLAPKQAALADQVRSFLNNQYFSDTLPFALFTPRELSKSDRGVFWAKMNPLAHQLAEIVTRKENNLSHKKEFQERIVSYIRSYDYLNETLAKQESALQAEKDALQAKKDALQAKKYAKLPKK
jgi:hypothetical protein